MSVYDIERSARRSQHKRGLANALRHEATPYERLLWRHLATKQSHGYRFRRQQPIGPYVVDFVCLARKLVIELDGQHHSGPEGRDGRRDEWLRRHGYTVLRFTNLQVKQDIESVLETIASHLHPPP
jgi:very-short-patch-repair endonuclease